MLVCSISVHDFDGETIQSQHAHAQHMQQLLLQLILQALEH